MSVELKVPPVGESITEVQIGEWVKAEGDFVNRDEVVCIIETDKVTVELPAPVSGILTSISVKNGAEAKVGEVIGHMEEGGAGAATSAAEAPAAASGQTQAAAAPKTPAPAPATPAFSAEAPSPGGANPVSERTQAVRESLPPHAFARVMPSAKRVLAERGIAPEGVSATGPGGRVLKEDAQRAAAPATARTPEREAEPPPKRPPAATLDAGAGRTEEVVRMTPMRRRIAQRLVESQHTAALLTTFNEIDMSEVMALRKQHQPKFLEKYGIKLGFMSFFVKAAVEALKEIPQVNAEVRDDSIVYRNYYDVGVAVGGGKGLVVPVIRNAERLSFAQVEQTISEFGARAKKNQLKLAELSGGTFTVSNGGVYGSLLSTPIVNPPQSGILGLHAIQERPIALGGQVAIRPMMYVALTYDHRIVDGREAVTFLKRIKECVEDPARILLEV
jgi:2-oxoglutarate dehydrogenase E2 component (dihydrolipoamide succinyltransferase)